MSLEVPWGTFLRCSGCKPALPGQNQEVIVPSLSIRRFLAGYVQSQRPSGYPQPQLHYSTINPIMLQDFAVGLWFRRLQKGSVKSGFFYIVSKILQHRLSTCKKSASSLPAVKDTCLFLTYAGEILLLPLPTVLDTYFRFLTTPRGP